MAGCSGCGDPGGRFHRGTVPTTPRLASARRRARRARRRAAGSLCRGTLHAAGGMRRRLAVAQVRDVACCTWCTPGRPRPSGRSRAGWPGSPPLLKYYLDQRRGRLGPGVQGRARRRRGQDRLRPNVLRLGGSADSPGARCRPRRQGHRSAAVRPWPLGPGRDGRCRPDRPVERSGRGPGATASATRLASASTTSPSPTGGRR